jgi:hypothetical protein
MSSIHKFQKYIPILKMGNTINLFSWRNILRSLLNDNLITNQEYNEYLFRHTNKKNKDNEQLRKKAEEFEKLNKIILCERCGNVINAGTHGYIFQSKNNTNHVIKGTIKGHSITTGCPKNFEHEVQMYSLIYPIFKKLNFDQFNIFMLEVYDRWIENRRCYYEMDKIFPYQLNNDQKKIIKDKINNYTTNNSKYLLNKFYGSKNLFMLTPGVPNKNYFSDGGNKFGTWTEIGDYFISEIFPIINIDKNQYYDLLYILLRNFISQGILLIDVEFILGSIKLDDGTFKNGIFMVDFDKTYGKNVVNDNDVNTLINQDMFPEYVRNKFKEEYYKKKYLKYKKKYILTKKIKKLKI